MKLAAFYFHTKLNLNNCTYVAGQLLVHLYFKELFSAVQIMEQPTIKS